MSLGRPTPAERVLRRLDKSHAPCWEFTGAKTRGYGMVGVGRRMLGAHRVVYEHFHGPNPEGKVVRHSCDNPPCCNPDHLVLGSQADNLRDARERGHARVPKLTDAQVCEIRTRYVHRFARSLKGGPPRSNAAILAKEYGVTINYVIQIVRGAVRTDAPGVIFVPGDGVR